MIKEKKIITFVIPVYNNYGSLLISQQKIKNHVLSELPLYEYEIIFINDGSKDESLLELLSIRENEKNVKVINFSRNFGQIPAILAGTSLAKGDIVISISADLQDPIEKVKEMIYEWEKGNEIVICFRVSRNDKLMNKLTSKVYFWMIQYHINDKIPKGGFDYYLLDRKAVNALNLINDKIRSLHYDILSLGFSKKFIPYERKKREIGKSQYNFFKRLRDFTNAFISISYIPIRAMIFTGFLFACSGFIYSLLIFLAWLQNETPFEGWSPIMILLLIIGGLIMIMLGVIGEYIWRIYEETKKRPNYIIKEIYQ
jgi:glycosyltransferase involved in cell wall biosynthesis